MFQQDDNCIIHLDHSILLGGEGVDREEGGVVVADEAAFEDFLKTLHDRSGPRYRQRVIEYKEYCAQNNYREFDVINLEHFILYLREERDEDDKERRLYCASTLSSITSQISMWFQSALRIKPMAELPNLKNLLHVWDAEEKTDGEEVPFFEVQEAFRFLDEAPNNSAFIGHKLVLILSMYGFLRKTEIAKFEFEKLKVQSECILGNICRGRLKGPRKLCHFAITDPRSRDILHLYYSFFREEDRTGRLLRKLDPKSNKPYLDKFWGVNSISKIPREIAKFLGKENHDAYTCRSLRITGALLAEVSADLVAPDFYNQTGSNKLLTVTNTMPLPKRMAPNDSSNSSARKRTTVGGDTNFFADTSAPIILGAGMGEGSAMKAALVCQSTQEQLYRYYPELKPADLCPGCEFKICFHANPLPPADAGLG